MSRRSHAVAPSMLGGALVLAALLVAGAAPAQPPDDAPSPWLADPPPTGPAEEAPGSDPATGSAPATEPHLAPVDVPATGGEPAPTVEPAPAVALTVRPRPAVDQADGDVDDDLPRYAQWKVGFEAGLRVVAATDASYDPYSPSDALTGGVVAATWTPLELGPVALGVVGEYAGSGSTGDARGLSTSLTVHRIALGAQGRLPLGQRVYLHAKAAPAAVHAVGSIDDPSLDRSLDAASWTWGLDATGGAAVLVARAGHPEAPAFRLWIVGEAGWSFAGRADMTHTPDEVDDDPRRFGEVTLVALDTGGLVHRFALAATF